MSDNDRVIFVPVDPRTYGLGMALGCLFRFWPFFLIVGLILWGIFGITIAVSNAENTRQANVWATEAANYQSTKEASQDDVQSQMMVLQSLRDNHQSLLLETKFGDSVSCEDSITIHSLEFAEDGVWLNFDAAMINNSTDNVDGSWLIWNPDQLYLNSYDEAGISPESTQVFRVLPNTTCETFWVEHFTGKLVFPYSRFLDQRGSTDGILYFALGDNSESKEGLYPLLDLSQADKWQIGAPSHSVHKMEASSLEIGDNANSNLILNVFEGDSVTDTATLSFTIAVDPSSGNFVLAKPEEVYLLVGNFKFPASRWNGVFDRYANGEFYELGWYNPPWSREGAIQFDSAWKESLAAGCFDFYYGNTYVFQHLCLR